jgi:mRNA interferase HigB
VRIITRGTLRRFWQSHPDAQEPLKTWYHEARKAHWKSPHEIKNMYRNASVIGDNRIVFNIAGNKYRLIVKFNYEFGIAYIRFIGSHRTYDTIDAENV